MSNGLSRILVFVAVSLLLPGCVLPATGNLATHDPTTTPPAGEERVQVEYVFDGDSFEISSGGNTDQVRLIGIDSPEYDECFGDEAQTFLRQFIDGEQVALRRDQRNRDRYDRLLRYVYLEDGTFVNESLVAAGMARARRYPPDTRYSTQLEEAQTIAQADSLGLWASEACRHDRS